jgi:cystathionine beta-lyase family protein involved in aluminum resistance
MMKENSTELNSKTQEINNYFNEEYNEEKIKLTNTLNQVKAYHENNIKNQTFQIEQAYQNNAMTKDIYEKSIKQVTESMEAVMRGELANIEAIFQKNVSEMNMMKSNALKEINNLFNAKSAEIQDRRAEALNDYNMALAKIQENEKIDYEALKKYFSEEKAKLDQTLNLLK